MVYLRLAFCLLLLTACGEERVDPLVPGGADDLPVLVDLDPDPSVVLVSLVAREAEVELVHGASTPAWVYMDGADPAALPRWPGPTLKAKTGDLVIVRFRNELSSASTTVHFHGIRPENHMDGAGNHAGDEVFPGESFEYRFVAKDSGTFWYHPHVSADEQVERGLYGPIVVSADPSPQHRERLLVLDDVDLLATGELDIEPDDDDLAMGRHGDTLLVNGAHAPSFAATAGSTERWRLVNAANGRHFELMLPGATLLVRESDGGALSAPRRVESLRVAPGERFTVDVSLDGAAGDELVVSTAAVDTGHKAMSSQEHDELFTLHLHAGAHTLPGDIPEQRLQPLVEPGAATTRALVLRSSLDSEFGPIFSINGEVWPFNTALRGASDAVEVWELTNESPGAHPFHLHGMFFQVLDDAGRVRADLGWKDTVNVPGMSRVRLAVRLSAGHWMFHCQIPEHAERGMMGEIRVER